VLVGTKGLKGGTLQTYMSNLLLVAYTESICYAPVMQVLAQARATNTIAFLDTGTGKTAFFAPSRALVLRCDLLFIAKWMWLK